MTTFQLSIQPLEKESRSGLYYNLYAYALHIHMPSIGDVRSLNHSRISESINWTNELSRRYEKYVNSIHNTAISADYEVKLHEMCDLILGMKSSVKRMFYTDSLYVYGNDLDELVSLGAAPMVTSYSIKEAVVDQPSGVIIQKEPKWSYRSFFRAGMFSKSKLEQLQNFVNDRRASYGITSGLAWKLRMRAAYISEQNFIDHNHPSDITMLSLVCPGIIRKTMAIVAK